MKESIIILKKELLEIFRDKTCIFILLMPILTLPIFIIGLNTLKTNTHPTSTTNICIQSDSEQSKNLFNQFISENNTLRVHIIDSSNPDKLLQNGDITCYIAIYNQNIDFIYNTNSYASLLETTKLGDSFQKFYNTALSESQENILQMNLKDENHILVDATSSISNIILPILLLTLILKSIITFSSDLFAGERERKTLELLLLSGVNRKSIYFGKTLTLFLLSLLNLLLTFLGFFISSFFTDSKSAQLKFMIVGNTNFNIAGMILTLIFLSVIAVFLTSTTSMISRNLRASQSFNSIIFLGIIGTTALVSLGFIQCHSLFFKFIPILNLIFCFNHSFIGIITISELLLGLFTNILFILLLIFIGIRYINTEKIL